MDEVPDILNRINRIATLTKVIINELQRKDYELFKDAKKAMPHITDEQWAFLHPKGKEYNQLVTMEEALHKSRCPL